MAEGTETLRVGNAALNIGSARAPAKQLEYDRKKLRGELHGWTFEVLLTEQSDLVEFENSLKSFMELRFKLIVHAMISFGDKEPALIPSTDARMSPRVRVVHVQVGLGSAWTVYATIS